MYLLIRYPAGVIVQAVALARGKNRMRIAASGFPDTIELRRSGLRWLTDAGEPIEFDFLMSGVYQGQVDSSSLEPGVAKAIGATAMEHFS
jgi:hypothetical protein